MQAAGRCSPCEVVGGPHVDGIVLVPQGQLQSPCFNPAHGFEGFQAPYYNGRLFFAGEHTSKLS